jgi:hypothetical protein
VFEEDVAIATRPLSVQSSGCIPRLPVSSSFDDVDPPSASDALIDDTVEVVAAETFIAKPLPSLFLLEPDAAVVATGSKIGVSDPACNRTMTPDADDNILCRTNAVETIIHCHDRMIKQYQYSHLCASCVSQQ